MITLFGGVVDLLNNTPNQSGATGAQIAKFGDNYLMSRDPTSPLFWGFNYYQVQTNFEYVGITSDLGHGWRVDNKTYTYRYWNKQNYNSLTAISATSAVDKLNGYRGTNQAVEISRFNITNLFFNYTVKESRLRGTKFRFGVNKLSDHHNIVGVIPASTATSLPQPGDTLLLMPGRSFSITMIAGYAPRR